MECSFSAFDLFEDVCGFCGPDEGFGLAVVVLDVGEDGLLQVFDAGEKYKSVVNAQRWPTAKYPDCGRKWCLWIEGVAHCEANGKGRCDAALSVDIDS